MSLKLKFALICRCSDRGFALPIAVGLGFVILLIAATLIMRSQGDQVTASAQKATAQGLGTAETGITRIQSLFNRYTPFATTTLTNIPATPPASPTSTWKYIYDNAPATVAGCPGAAGLSLTEVSKYLLNQWIDLDSGGQFRVTEYTYTPDSAQITASATIPASGSVTLNISPADYLLDSGSVYGEVLSVPGILSRNGATYTFTRLGSGTATSVASTDTFIPKNTSATVTSSIIIPASGSVSIADSNISPSNYLADGGSVKGQIQGIQGTLSRSGSTYTFERFYSGTAITTAADFVPVNTPGVGRLSLEGRINQAGSGNTATETVSTATTKLLVNIPVKSGSLNNQVPALWVKNSGITNMNSNKVNGNILINSCPPATGATDTNLSNPATQDVIAVPTPLPETPNLPASYYTLTGSSAPWTNFPRPGDTPAADGYYHYLIDELKNPTGNSEINIEAGKKVVFYVKGDIDLSGNPDLNKASGNTSDQLQIYGNTYTSATTTKYGCGSLVINTSCPTRTAHFNGTGTMKAFVHAPDATGSVNGGGNTNGNFIGTLWIKDWNASDGNSKVKVDASGDYGKYLVSQKIVKPPVVSPITSWQRQEVP
ncbi:hypothetical protein C7Y66_26050 [Chroococcidiopsis sp. CCALA 051]|uniref:hypothetical protein n=1 Tax=Chroococcidiopsis sp. CCALA 051 TaxID=869949 RepID=UPI000D0D4B3E|nr:hypothetical protein [Chroococcidiopsis sp. CCALA 051]PSM46244.1 hypothetical protein C7Y66_26050 [Chroococcidiopsis sp. CCALA 051]